MGQEFAQRAEWSEGRALDWHLLGAGMHEGMRLLVRDLNQAYRSIPALHARDCEADGFEWLIADDSENSVYAWLRKSPDDDPVAIITNFTPVVRHDYVLPLPRAGRWHEVLNSDAQAYGGSGQGNGGFVEAKPQSSGGCAARLTLPPLATLYLRQQA